MVALPVPHKHVQVRVRQRVAAVHCVTSPASGPPLLRAASVRRCASRPDGSAARSMARRGVTGKRACRGVTRARARRRCGGCRATCWTRARTRRCWRRGGRWSRRSTRSRAGASGWTRTGSARARPRWCCRRRRRPSCSWCAPARVRLGLGLETLPSRGMRRGCTYEGVTLAASPAGGTTFWGDGQEGHDGSGSSFTR